MSKTFVIKKATKATLRGRYNTTGEFITLYLDWGSGKDRGSDFQPDRIYSSPKTPDEKQHNEIIIKKAKKKLALKDAELLTDKTQLQSKLSNVDFMTFFNFAKTLPKKNGKPKELSTIETYTKAMESICVNVLDLNKVRLKDIDKEFVRELRLKILNSKAYDHNTKSMYYQWFTSFLTVAVKNDYMESNPCGAVETISMDENSVNFILHEDIQKLNNANCPCPVLKKAGLFSSQTGMRSGDIKVLKWKQIRKVDDYYRIVLKQEKTDKPYTIHFRQDLMDLLGGPGDQEDYVFPGFKNNDITNKNILIWFLTAKVIPSKPEDNFTMHDFRHTFAITLGLNGANLYEIAQLLGHSNTSTSEKHYARILEQMKQKIVFNLPKL